MPPYQVAKTIYLVGFVGIILIVIFVAIFSEDTAIQQQSFSKTRELLQTFKNGQIIAFDLEPQQPITEFVYRQVTKQETVTDADGTQKVQNVTTIEQVPASEVYLQTKDRQTGLEKICKLGFQCDITGRVILTDPNNPNNQIKPPYQIFYTIDCDFRDYCNLSPPVARHMLTEADGSFKYTWIPTYVLKLEGTEWEKYRTFVRATSEYKDIRGQYIVNEHTMYITLIE